MDAGLSIGIALMDAALGPDNGVRRRLLARVEDAGLQHVTLGDHVAFHGGRGFNAVVNATAALTAHDRLPALLGVYLLGLRHPMLAARSLADIARIAPGRLTLGVGVAGEDRREVANSGVDPRTRGRQLDEVLLLVRRLLAGETVDHEGEFFRLEDARIDPVPDPPIPIVVGGRGEPAIARAAALGDGWLGIFCSPRRYAETRERIREATAAHGRPAPSWWGLSIWCGVDPDPDVARELLDADLRLNYRLPYDDFRHVVAVGDPDAIADRLAAYVAAGARHVTVIPGGSAERPERTIDLVAEAARLLRERAAL